jgi:hypothetical protein
MQFRGWRQQIEYLCALLHQCQAHRFECPQQTLRGRLRAGARRPAARVLYRLRQVPMIERSIRLDLVFEQAIHNAVVKIEASLIDLSASVRQNARPRNRKAILAQPQLFH